MEAGFQLALDSAPFLLKGAYFTVILSLGGMFFGLLLGFGLALMRLSRFKLLRWTSLASTCRSFAARPCWCSCS